MPYRVLSPTTYFNTITKNPNCSIRKIEVIKNPDGTKNRKVTYITNEEHSPEFIDRCTCPIRTALFTLALPFWTVGSTIRECTLCCTTPYERSQIDERVTCCTLPCLEQECQPWRCQLQSGRIRHTVIVNDQFPPDTELNFQAVNREHSENSPLIREEIR